ncbi:MAG TPA: KH domain-containing protein [Anaerolineae bacterium]|nr:KH domain-containing protein [Anaerolineae bacterium]
MNVNPVQIQIASLVEGIVTALADHPETVTVQAQMGVDPKTQQDKVDVNLTVHFDDMGRIIGKQGRTINAIRTLAGLLAAKNEMRASVELVE